LPEHMPEEHRRYTHREQHDDGGESNSCFPED
jgi:hypothetical protein